MAILQQPGTGYRDPSKAMSIKALQSRMKAAQEAAAQATQIQNPITSPTAGLAHLAGVAAAGFGQSQAENREADARGQLAQIMSGVGPEGPTPQQTALINQLDPDLGGKIFENAMEARRQEDQQKHAMDLQGGQQTFTAGESQKTREATTTENELNRQAEDARMRAQEAAADGRQDDQQAAAQELARINAELDVEKAKSAQTIKTEAIGTESAAKVAEAERLGLVKGTPEYQKFVFDISPSAATNITTNVGGGKKLDETLDTEEGKIWSGHQKERNIAAGSQKDMTMLGELSTQVPNGPIMGNLATLPVLKNFSNAGQAFNSIVQRVAPTLRVEGSGSTSDIEYAGMLNSLPALGNYPEANQLIIGMMQAKSAINIERGNIVDQYRNGEITDIQARQKLAEVNQRSIMNPELDALMQRVTGGGGSAAPATGGGSADIDEILKGIP